MTRKTGQTAGAIELEDDEAYRGALVKPEGGWLQKGDPKYGDEPRLCVEWEVKGQKANVRDWMAIKLGQRSDGTVSKLRQLLNALAEHGRDDEVWFDDETLEWGYGDDAYATLVPGMQVVFKGENRKNGKGQTSYRVLSYKAVGKAKASA